MEPQMIPHYPVQVRLGYAERKALHDLEERFDLNLSDTVRRCIAIAAEQNDIDWPGRKAA